MTMASRHNTLNDAAYWYVPLCRALPAAMLAIVITFSADHSPELGLLTFGIFAVLTGLAVGALSLRTIERGVERSTFLAHGVLTLVAGAVALLVPEAGLGVFLVLVTSWAALTGFLELYAGFRARGRHGASRDWIFVGALTVLLAIVVLLVPPGFREQFTGPDGVDRVLSASVIVVGILGAYGAITAVYLIIGGLSLKWAPTTPALAGDAASSDSASSTIPSATQDGTAS
jgi:uncharacterized membrane protein HdeD (DUF308 family)